MSRRGRTRRLFCCPKITERRFWLWYLKSRQLKTRKVYLMTLRCSAEPKVRYLAQNSSFTAITEPIWLNNEIRHNERNSGFRYRAAQRYAEISVSDSRFSLCPTGCVSRYSKQGLCVPQKSQSQPNSAASLGAQPPIPREKGV